MAATTVEPSPGAGERASGKAKSEAARLRARERVYWRAVVKTGGRIGASREKDRVEWHLAACEAPRTEGSHCNEGLHLIETVGQPDGHCIINGKCGTCGDQPRASGRSKAAA
jgi:hypothetical protein